MPDAPEAKVRALAGAHRLFRAKPPTSQVEKLSGGEKARLLLGLATFGGPHLLILDEPTNHLDIDSRAALIEAINDYPGAVILVSHDRYLLDACADRLWLVADGKVTPFDGDLDDYRRRVLSDRERRRAPTAATAPQAAAQCRRAQARGRAARRRQAAAAAASTRAEAEIARLDPRDREARRRARRRRPVRARSGEGRGAGQDARRTRRARSRKPKRNGWRPARRCEAAID